VCEQGRRSSAPAPAPGLTGSCIFTARESTWSAPVPSTTVFPRESELGLCVCAPDPAFLCLVYLVAALSVRARIPALPHPVCPVSALAGSPVAWSRRLLYLSDNKIVSVAGVKFPSSILYVSPLTCSVRQSTHHHAAALRLSCRRDSRWLPVSDSPVAWSRRWLDLNRNVLTSKGLLQVTWPESLG
jgi:hypothetical protein